MKTESFYFTPFLFLRRILPICLVFIFAWHAASSKENPGTPKKPVTAILKATPCSNGLAKTDLDINNVRAKILTDGDMWWDLTSPRYEIPKNSGKHSLYCGAVWFGGIDASMQVKVAGQTYRQTGNDWWPGPIDTVSVSTDAAVCVAYDKHWKITRASVLDFVQNGTTTNEILTWPGNGNASLNHGQFLAPFYDMNGDGVYDPTQGDYPGYDIFNSGGNCISGLQGDQTLWWAFNDVGNVHSETGSAQIGLEVHAQAFAFASNVPAIDNATFYQYKIINRSSTTYTDCYFGQWVDPDLGNFADDYVGCDVTRGMGYCYNGDNDDEGVEGYGIDPPAIGVDFLKGPLADAGDGVDNNRNGITDEPGEDIMMSRFIYYNNVNNTPTGNPNGFMDYYNFLRSIWLDNIPMTYGGDGRNPTNPVCNFMFPDNTDSLLNATQGPWTEITAGNAPDDRRFLQSAGPFTMLPGEVNYISVGVPWARALPGGGPASSIAELKLADDIIQHLFDSCFMTTGISTIAENPFQVLIAPVPFHDETIVTFNNKNSQPFTLSIYDIHGKMVKEIKNIMSNRVKLDRNNMAGGVYIIKLADNKGNSYSRKIVAE